MRVLFFEHPCSRGLRQRQLCGMDLSVRRMLLPHAFPYSELCVRRPSRLRRLPSSVGPLPVAYRPEAARAGMTSPIRRSMRPATRRSLTARPEDQNHVLKSLDNTTQSRFMLLPPRVDRGQPHGATIPEPSIRRNISQPDGILYGCLFRRLHQSDAAGPICRGRWDPLSGFLPRTGARRQYRNQGGRS